MKTLVYLLACSFALAAAPAPTHRVDNLGNCYRLNADGTETNLGQPADAIRNHPGEASGIQRAALKLLADFQTKLAADLKAAQDAAAAQVAAAQKASADAIAASAAELAALKAEVAELKAKLAAAAKPAP